MSDNWVVQNLQNTLGPWNEKLGNVIAVDYLKSRKVVR